MILGTTGVTKSMAKLQARVKGQAGGWLEKGIAVIMAAVSQSL